MPKTHNMRRMIENSTPGALAGEVSDSDLSDERPRAGLWRHPLSGEEAHTLDDPLFGNAQSAAFARLGFVRIRDTKPEEIHRTDIAAVGRGNAETDSLKGLSARVSQMEAENKRLQDDLEKSRKANEAGASTDSVAVAQSAQDAKQDAVDQIKDRGQGDTSEVTVPKVNPENFQNPISQDDGKPEDSALTGSVRDENKVDTSKPIADQNATELRATAAQEGVDVSKADTKKDFRTAIQKSRDEKEKAKNEESEDK